MSELETLRARLSAAEQVCILYGWTGSSGDSDRDRATTQAWMDWAHAYPDAQPKPSSKEWQSRIDELSTRRTAIRNATLQRLRGEDVAP